MNRGDIYNNYFMANNTVLLDMGTYLNGITYSLYETRDTKVKFYKAFLDTYKMLDCKEVNSEGITVLKPPLKSDIDGVPVISFKGLCAAYVASNMDYFIMDLSNCDLSNFICIELMGREHREFCLNVKFPSQKDKMLKPVKVTGILPMKCKDIIDDILSNVDLSEAIDLGGLCGNTDIEEFDFDKYNIHKAVSLGWMFTNCDVLERVSGHSVGVISNIHSIFKGCSELKYISPDVFKHAMIFEMGGAFELCTNLKNLPISRENIDLCGNISYNSRAFMGCNSIDTESVTRLLMYLRNNEIFLDRPFYGCTGRYYAGSVTCKVEDMHSILDGSKFDIVDLSHVWFINGDRDNDSYGILNMSGNFGYMDRDSLMSEGDLFGEIVPNLTEIYTIPGIIIVNRSMYITKLDKHIFDILDFSDISREHMLSKVDFIRITKSSEKYLILV